MPLNQIPRKLALLLSVAMLIGGVVLVGWAFIQLTEGSSLTPGLTVSNGPAGANAALARSDTIANSESGAINDAAAVETMTALAASFTTPAPAATSSGPTASGPTPSTPTASGANGEPAVKQPASSSLAPVIDSTFELIPAAVSMTDSVPPGLRTAVEQSVLIEAGAVFTTTDPTTAALHIDLKPRTNQRRGRVVYEQLFVAAAAFDTIDPNITWDELVTVWQGASEPYAAVVVLTDTLPALQQILSRPGPTVRGVATIEQAAAAARSARPPLVIVPFDDLIPKLAVLAIDGQNPVENKHKFEPRLYPLVAKIYAHNGKLEPEQRPLVHNLLLQLPPSNRDPDRLTVLAMTGVTAMVRQTAAAMDERGDAWPAAVVGPELAAADITHISNEVPFVPGCQTDISSNNLTFCSKLSYMATLDAVGADIIGLTGNHQNDYGREDALTSLAIYAEAGLSVYGGGVNKEDAFAPLYLVHNGNRLAFLGANSFGPPLAWATDELPGSAEFDLNIMSAMIRNIKAQDKADVVLAELQYEESYNVAPLLDQRQNFNALVRVGADIVTGVQSHVPQAVEFTEGRLILYGLGNLFFDQMWSQETRDGMFVKHTIYNGRHISTQVFTTVLYDYGQPRWATAEERAHILTRVFGASYWE